MSIQVILLVREIRTALPFALPESLGQTFIAHRKLWQRKNATNALDMIFMNLKLVFA
jgi:hypothetical protein